MPHALKRTSREPQERPEKMAGLMFWYAWKHLRDVPDEAPIDVVRHRIDLAGLLDIRSENHSHLSETHLPVDTPAWNTCIAKLSELLQRYLADDDSSRLETAVIEYLRPHLTRRLQIDSEHPFSWCKGYQCGSLRYNLQPEAERPEQVFIHIANAVCPNSIFAEPDYLPRCLRDLMSRTEKTLGVSELKTISWLNSTPRWLAIMGPAWTKRLGEPMMDIQGHLGFWGQFLTARRTFNETLANQFRATGRLPYPMRSAWCTFAELQSHLNTLECNAND